MTYSSFHLSCKLQFIIDAGWSSLVARQAHNLKVVGSNPTPATKNFKMTKKFAYVIYKILNLLDSLINTLSGRKYLFWLKDFFHEDSYTKLLISNKKVTFFVPNSVTELRVKTLFTKEPETIKWIDNFDNQNDFIFWDIGSNIGQYSIYASLKHSNCHTISFEPSTSNLRVLSRNISINNLSENIDIFSLPLTDKWGEFLMMNEKNFDEGRAQNSFGENVDFQGKNFSPKTKYKVMGISIDKLIEDKIMKVPNYIKIDVDGIELKILEGAKSILANKELKSISMEINEGLEEQYKSIIKLLSESGLEIKSKDRAESAYADDTKFKKQFNFVFERTI